jgi:hypothetical protein
MHAYLLHVYVHALLYLFIYLTLVIMGIGHDLVRVQLCSNKDRSLSCLRHPFGSVAFPFISSRMAFSLLTGSFYSYVSSHLAL